MALSEWPTLTTSRSGSPDNQPCTITPARCGRPAVRRGRGSARRGRFEVADRVVAVPCDTRRGGDIRWSRRRARRLPPGVLMKLMTAPSARTSSAVANRISGDTTAGIAAGYGTKDKPMSEGRGPASRDVGGRPARGAWAKCSAARSPAPGTGPVKTVVRRDSAARGGVGQKPAKLRGEGWPDQLVQTV
jgi:hypothetical protein